MTAWIGETPRTCDVCHTELGLHFIDGKIPGQGWGILCLSCHAIHGVGLGPGRGQAYNIGTGLKVEPDALPQVDQVLRRSDIPEPPGASRADREPPTPIPPGGWLTQP